MAGRNAWNGPGYYFFFESSARVFAFTSCNDNVTFFLSPLVMRGRMRCEMPIKLKSGPLKIKPFHSLFNFLRCFSDKGDVCAEQKVPYSTCFECIMISDFSAQEIRRKKCIGGFAKTTSPKFSEMDDSTFHFAPFRCHFLLNLLLPRRKSSRKLLHWTFRVAWIEPHRFRPKISGKRSEWPAQFHPHFNF